MRKLRPPGPGSAPGPGTTSDQGPGRVGALRPWCAARLDPIVLVSERPPRQPPTAKPETAETEAPPDDATQPDHDPHGGGLRPPPLRWRDPCPRAADPRGPPGPGGRHPGAERGRRPPRGEPLA